MSTLCCFSTRFTKSFCPFYRRYILYLFLNLVFASPTFLSVGSEEVVILKNVYTDCIPIQTNTILYSFSISPELPPGMNIDSHRSCIGGIYTGSNYGKHDFVLEGRNNWGFIRATITLYFSSFCIFID